MVTGQLSSLLLQVAFFLALVRVLDTYQYGLFIGVTAFVAILAQFATLGQGTILIRRLAQADLPFSTLWGTTLRTAWIGCAVVSLLALLSGPLILRKAALLSLLPTLLLSDLVCNKLIELASQAFQACHQFRTASHINLLPNLAKLAAVLWVILQLAFTKRKIDALHWSVWYAAASVLACALALYLARQKLGTAHKSRFAREDLWEGFFYDFSCS